MERLKGQKGKGKAGECTYTSGRGLRTLFCGGKETDAALPCAAAAEWNALRQLKHDVTKSLKEWRFFSFKEQEADQGRTKLQ